MIEVKKFFSFDETNWNSLVSNSSMTTIYNTSEYINVMQKSFDYKPIYFLVFDDGKPVAGVNIFKKSAISIPILTEFSKFYFSYAPLFVISSKEDVKDKYFDLLIKEIISDYKKNFIASINLWNSPYNNIEGVFQSNNFDVHIYLIPYYCLKAQ